MDVSVTDSRVLAMQLIEDQVSLTLMGARAVASWEQDLVWSLGSIRQIR